MKKVLMVHGLDGMPNSGWKPWLMSELRILDIYAYCLAMPNPHEPVLSQWVNEIARVVKNHQDDEIFFVGHSLGTTAILRYLQSPQAHTVSGAVLVSGPISSTNNERTDSFQKDTYNFDLIKKHCSKFAVIHGDNDLLVPVENAFKLAGELEVKPILIPNGAHLNGSAGWDKLPECLKSLKSMLGLGALLKSKSD